MNRADVIIVGAGAAGLATAIFLGRHRPGTRILALDGARKLGAKILISGGGRCNVTNARVTARDFFGGRRHVLEGVFRAHSAGDSRRFFESLGVRLHEEEYGKLFPDSNSARSVVTALLQAAETAGARLLTGHRVDGISRVGQRFQVVAKTAGGQVSFEAPVVVLATGGLSFPKTGSDGSGYGFARALGHRIVPTTPALDPLTLAGDLHGGLAGISQPVVLTFKLSGKKPIRIAGPLLWTHFGWSGPAALDVSRFVNRGRVAEDEWELQANFVGGSDFAAVEQQIIGAAGKQPRMATWRLLRPWMPARVAETFCGMVGVGKEHVAGQLTRAERRALVHSLTEWRAPVTGSRGYRYAEVTAGGVALEEVAGDRMLSRRCPGLYLVGEILDVDGRLGGFNFQWAWSSAWVAAMAIGRWLDDEVGRSRDETTAAGT